MIFGSVPVEDAADAILAHSHRAGKSRLKKGTRLSPADLKALTEAGERTLVVARLEHGDMTEDEAAAAIGEALAGAHIRIGEAATGRANVFAGTTGLFVPDRRVVDAVNAVDPGITLATLGEYEPVTVDRMVATVKIIPLAVPGAAVAAVVDILRDAAAFRLAPFSQKRVALIQTELPTVKPSMLDKTRKATEARLGLSGSEIVAEIRCPHETGALTDALRRLDGADLTLVFGASAVIDADDVIPAAIRAAGGTVDHLGMPVDPGNLLLLGHLAGAPVLGAPGCARSPKENGFDWVLNRLLADLFVTGADIRGMGVGGLLMEIASRPQPRESESGDIEARDAEADGFEADDAEAGDTGFGGRGPARRDDPVVDIVVLAAGRSSRMGGPNKLLATFDGVPLIRRSVMTALAAKNARTVRVVAGHMADDIAGALTGLDVETVENPAFAEGLSTSLKAGFAACRGADGVMVMLADQPLLSSADLDRLIAAFTGEGAGAIVAASDRGRRRNPVILSTAFADAIAALTGDIGAAPIIAANPDALTEVELGAAAGTDVDTPEALERAGGRLW
ncbi:NTP transferase domain-containing protein [Aurantimonas sp. VKM B-3413]|uniref:NTP transferase domain-containing protein n=1 Tax=Aurantimonas sp. VKM B-3413 TaxID=2779401 RepID=UPI001E33D3BF|nr:molybdopterin-binding/glycosyltransferase family 2 protein [Aurantimonas sp. VKM B-3413]MCB8839739.1 molybdopterin-binding/glycosyltransferase family 2 protein [Aurantimonas sp. VKM B-3413]